MNFEPILTLGLMSGTSADGIDAALIRTDGEGSIEFVASSTTHYDDSLRNELLEAAQLDLPFERVLDLERRLTEAHVLACQRMLDDHDSAGKPELIGFHGHTLRHDSRRKLTWQIGDGSWLSEHLGIPVVNDFRRADLAAGGEGAPLAPLYHQQLMACVEKPTLILNLGGVANVTWLGENGAICAGDVGPGCGLVDMWIQRNTENRFDVDGQLAAAGTVHQTVVDLALKKEFFRRPLPKSADRFEFDFVDVARLSLEDGAATLCAITARGVRSSFECLAERPKSIWVTGGGTHNRFLMSLLERELGNVHPMEDLGLRSDSLEAECFAWLAVRRFRHLSTSVPETTGCSQATSGGAIHEPTRH